MKRLLVLLLVFDMTSLAGAVTLDISVHLPGPDGELGTQDDVVINEPVSSEIYLEPGDLIWLDINGTVMCSQGEYAAPFWIIQGPGRTTQTGQILQGDGTIYYYHPDYIIDPEHPEWGTWGEYFESLGYSGVQPYIELDGFYDLAEPYTDLTGILVDYKEFHCEGLGDVTITLVGFDDEGIPFEYDQLIIHQIPEPATLLLLGLGGLFLKRRR